MRTVITSKKFLARMPLELDGVNLIHLEDAMAESSEWAKSYRSAGALRTLTTDALTILTSAGVLTATGDDPATWVPTGAHGYWLVRLSSPDSPTETVADDLFTQDGIHD